MNNFVVYAYCRKDGTFYYIGKGKPYRPYVWRGKRGINPPRDRSRILILHSGLSEEKALSYEQGLILFYGRKDTGTGLLKNKTDGGEGTCGWIPSREYREKRSEQSRNLHVSRKDTDGKSKIAKKSGAAMNRVKHAQRDEYGRSLAGKESNFAKQARPIRVTNLETGETFDFANSVDAGLALGLGPRSLRRVASGERKKHKGFKAEFTDSREAYT
jgi:hypothetical protein